MLYYKICWSICHGMDAYLNFSDAICPIHQSTSIYDLGYTVHTHTKIHTNYLHTQLTCPLSHGGEKGLWQWKPQFRKKHPAGKQKFHSIVENNCSTKRNKKQIYWFHHCPPQQQTPALSLSVRVSAWRESFKLDDVLKIKNDRERGESPAENTPIRKKTTLSLNLWVSREHTDIISKSYMNLIVLLFSYWGS